MQQYLDMLKLIMTEGDDKGDRTGTGTRSVFGHQIKLDLRKGFPLLTTKRVPFKSILVELLWFLRGGTNVRFLQEHGVKIWDEWADENGDLGPVYGKQWRDFGGVDQIAEVEKSLRENPEGRRHIVSAWNPVDVPKMKLPPCHCFFQFSCARREHDNEGDDKDWYLDCQLYQRSCDVFLGVPFNIASYALLTEMMAHVLGYEARYFVHTYGDLHIYDNHRSQVFQQLNRTPLTLPTVFFKSSAPSSDITKFEINDVELVGYMSHGAIKAPVAV